LNKFVTKLNAVWQYKDHTNVQETYSFNLLLKNRFIACRNAFVNYVTMKSRKKTNICSLKNRDTDSDHSSLPRKRLCSRVTAKLLPSINVIGWRMSID